MTDTAYRSLTKMLLSYKLYESCYYLNAAGHYSALYAKYWQEANRDEVKEQAMLLAQKRSSE